MCVYLFPLLPCPEVIQEVFENAPSMVDHPEDDIEETPAPLWSTIVARPASTSSHIIKGFVQTIAAKSSGFNPAAPKPRASNMFVALQVPEAGVEPEECGLEHQEERARIWRT